MSFVTPNRRTTQTVSDLVTKFKDDSLRATKTTADLLHMVGGDSALAVAVAALAHQLLCEMAHIIATKRADGTAETRIAHLTFSAFLALSGDVKEAHASYERFYGNPISPDTLMPEFTKEMFAMYERGEIPEESDG